MTARVTVILLCCDQQRYVREAFAALLAQSGAPIEIVATDDASTDATFSVLQELAAAYRGPHRVVVRRNAARLGLPGNLNAAVREASGSLIVSSAADDVSRPDRVETLRQLWSARGTSAVFSEARMMDADGRILGLFAGEGFRPVTAWRDVLRGALPLFGCSLAFERTLYEVFGPLPDDAHLEDLALGLRALLMKGVAYTPEPLVLYRRHDANYSKDRNYAARLDRDAYAAYLGGVLLTRAAMQRSFARDLATAEAHGLLASGARERRQTDRRARLLEAGGELVLGRRSPAAFLRALPSTLTADQVVQAAKCLLVRAAPGLREWKHKRGDKSAALAGETRG